MHRETLSVLPASLEESTSLYPLPESELRRIDLRKWILNYVPKGGVGAEVGAFRGHFSELLLQWLEPRKTWFIDTWTQGGEFYGSDKEALLAPTGQTLWVAQEADLDAVTALSGSGPAYVFYFVEAMMQAAVEMGLDAAQGRQLALATFRGATALAETSGEAPETLRARVTSKGGTTHAAITTMDALGVKEAIVKALHAAQERARELGQG